MTLAEATKIVGPRPNLHMRMMERALSLHPWLNTPTETERLTAARIVLGKEKPS